MSTLVCCSWLSASADMAAIASISASVPSSEVCSIELCRKRSAPCLSGAAGAVAKVLWPRCCGQGAMAKDYADRASPARRWGQGADLEGGVCPLADRLLPVRPLAQLVASRLQLLGQHGQHLAGLLQRCRHRRRDAAVSRCGKASIAARQWRLVQPQQP